jgi:hypothetical protein
VNNDFGQQLMQYWLAAAAKVRRYFINNIDTLIVRVFAMITLRDCKTTQL